MDTVGEEMQRMDVTVKFAEETHKYISDYIKHADQKAGFMFAYCTTAMVFLYQKGAVKNFLTSPETRGLILNLAVIALISFGVAVFRSIMTLLPRSESSQRTATCTTSLGFIHWETISSCYKTPYDYSKAIIQLPPQNLVMSKLEHCYELALVSKAKHHHLNKGIFWAIIGVTSTVMFLFIE